MLSLHDSACSHNLGYAGAPKSGFLVDFLASKEANMLLATEIISTSGLRTAI